MSKQSDKPISSVALFEQKTVRRVWHNEHWYFSVIDTISILADTTYANRYWSDLKRKLTAEGYVEVYEKIVRLKMEAPDGKMREIDAANTATMLRIIQSIPLHCTLDKMYRI
jgi:hypothetical protein